MLTIDNRIKKLQQASQENECNNLHSSFRTRATYSRRRRMELLKISLVKSLKIERYLGRTNGLLIFISIIFVSVGVYITVQIATSNWPNALFQWHILFRSSLIPIYALLILSSASLGHVTLRRLDDSSMPKSLQGTQLLIYHCYFLLIIIAIEMISISCTLILLLYQTHPVNGGLTYIEKLFAFVFNGLFFASAYGGTTAFDPLPFWGFVGLNCGEELSMRMCFKFFPFSSGNCRADEITCSAQNWEGSACPYNICRPAIESFSRQTLIYILCAAACVLILHLLNLALAWRVVHIRNKSSAIPPRMIAISSLSIAPSEYSCPPARAPTDTIVATVLEMEAIIPNLRSSSSRLSKRPSFLMNRPIISPSSTADMSSDYGDDDIEMRQTEKPRTSIRSNLY